MESECVSHGRKAGEHGQGRAPQDLGITSRSGNHVFQAQLTLLCDLVEIQKPRLGQPRFQKFLAGLAQGIRNVPTCTHEGRILGDIRGAHGERRDIQREVQRW